MTPKIRQVLVWVIGSAVAGTVIGALIGGARMVFMHHGPAPLTIGTLIGAAAGIGVGLIAFVMANA